MNKTKKELLLRHKLSLSDFYSIDDKVIIRRTGMDKLEKSTHMSVTVASLLQTPYKDKVHVTIYGTGRLADGATAQTVAEANPDNCEPSHSHYASIAYKRLRHRLLLMLLNLYEEDIYSEEESSDLREAAKKSVSDMVGEVEKMIGK